MTLLKVPSSFAKYGDHEAASGIARIGLSSNGNSSRTIINHLKVRAPLLVQRAMHPDTEWPAMAHVYVMSSAGGILQGDRLVVGIEAGENTISRITTQSATKIYRMEKGYASQTIDITANAGSYVEFIPRQLIPYRSSRFLQEVTISAAAGSTVVYSETVSAGRTASGEKFDFDVCFLRMRASDSKGRLLFADVCNIEPSALKRDALDRIFGGRTILSTIYILSEKDIQPGIEQEISDAVGDKSMFAGCSSLPNECGLFVRVLDDSIDRIEELTGAVTKIVRSHAIGRGIAKSVDPTVN